MAGRIGGTFLNTIMSCPFDLQKSSTRILWEITGKCNLNCSHCLYFGNQVEHNDDLAFEDLVNILDSIAVDGEVKYIWLSGGEPLLYKEIVEFVEEISKRGIVPSISTNGVLLTDKLASDLYNAGIRYVHVSLDGADAQVHDKLRCSIGAFDKTMQGISYLKDNHIRVGASYMVTVDSVNQIKDFIELAIGNELDVVSFYLIAPIGRGIELQSSNEYELMQETERILNFYKDITDIKIEVFRTISKMQKEDVGSGLMECRGECFYTITNSGELVACPWLAKKNIIDNVSLLSKSFSEAKMCVKDSMQSYLKKRKDNIYKVCSNCTHVRNCGSGCPAVSLEYDLDPLCKYLL